MTIEERAETIVKIFIGPILTQAVEEAICERFEGEDCIVARLEQAAYAKGFSEAREMAAKIANKHSGSFLEGDLEDLDIAKKIRAMSPAVTKSPTEGKA